MPTRKAFLATAAGAAATASGLAGRELSDADPKPTPTPKPVPTASTQPTEPSKLALELARSLQKDLPKANLSDAMTEKIAADIQDNFAIGGAFRNRPNEGLPPPDFVFVAAAEDRP